MEVFFQQDCQDDQEKGMWELFLVDEDGASAIEYGLVAALIGATVIGAQTAMGQTVVNMYQNAINIIVGAMGS